MRDNRFNFREGITLTPNDAIKNIRRKLVDFINDLGILGLDWGHAQRSKYLVRYFKPKQFTYNLQSTIYLQRT